MSTAPITAAQNSIHFPWTQEIWNQAWRSDNDSSIKSLCCKIACIVFPIIFTVALLDGVLWIGRSIQQAASSLQKSSLISPSVKNTVLQQKEANPPVNIVKIEDSVKNTVLQQKEANPPVNIVKIEDNAEKITNSITVTLHKGSSQHDIENNPHDLTNLKPEAADALHALDAAYCMSYAFNSNVKLIEAGDTKILSESQRSIIQQGTKEYFFLLKVFTYSDPTLMENINPENPRVCMHILQDKHLYFEPINQDTKPVNERTHAIVEHLFIPQKAPETVFAFRDIVQIAWIKNGNQEAFAAICAANKTIVFNSHKNEITMIYGKEHTQAFLTEILKPFAQLENGIDTNPFSYALGQYNRK